MPVKEKKKIFQVKDISNDGVIKNVKESAKPIEIKTEKEKYAQNKNFIKTNEIKENSYKEKIIDEKQTITKSIANPVYDNKNEIKTTVAEENKKSKSKNNRRSLSSRVLKGSEYTIDQLLSGDDEDLGIDTIIKTKAGAKATASLTKKNIDVSKRVGKKVYKVATSETAKSFYAGTISTTKKLKQCVTIGVAGTQNHIGTTSQALLITKFLTDLKLNVCYIQANGKEDIQTLEDMYDITKKDDFISYENIDMYEKDKTINAMGYGYDFYVYDMGNLQEINDIDSFITKDVRIVVSGTKAWEQDNLLKIFNKLGVLEDINFIFNFTPVEEQSEITKNMGKFGVKTYFSKYVPNPFIPTENEKLYHSLFKDYIAEKSSSLEIVPIKRSIFNLFRRQVK